MKEEKLPAESIKELFFSPKVKGAISKVIPKHLSTEKLLQVAITVIRRNPQLLQCSKQSLLSAVMGAAILGLELEPALGQAYIVPFKNKYGYMEAQLIPGYRGYIALANRSGEIESVSAHEVYSKDFFEYELGLNPKLRHIPAEGERGEFRGAYVVFRHKSGESTFEYMSKEKIDKIMSLTKSRDKDGNIVGPWKEHYVEMARKTVVRHRAKYEPISVEFAKAGELEERAILGESQIDLLPSTEEIESEEETKEIDFNGLVMLKAKEGKDISGLKDFIIAVAEANKVTEDEVKKEALSDWENFWTMYEKWKEQNINQNRKRGRPPKNEKSQEQFELISEKE